MLLMLVWGTFTPVPLAADGPAPHSIILFIGDGMGAVHRTAAQWQAVGADGQLAMDGLPYASWSQTASANAAITDSAAGATALATGAKTNNGIISQTPDGTPLTTILEEAQAKGMAVGLVTTTQIGHATPAAFAAHVPSRNMMTEIVSQMIDKRVDVLLGGGEADFLPASTAGCHTTAGAGHRTDGRNLLAEAQGAGYTIVCTSADLNAIIPASGTRLLGLFASNGMTRPFSPSLAEMTNKAIDILAQDPDGFFLMIEGGQIDWAAHNNDASNVIGDTLGFDDAIALAQTHPAVTGRTLLIVTADHETGGMSLNLTNGQDGPFFMPNGTPFYVNWSTTGHTGVDVPTTAGGHCANYLTGTYANTTIYNVMQLSFDPCFSASMSGTFLGKPAAIFTFTATVSPLTTTQPITYVWQTTGHAPLTHTGNTSDSVAFSWPQAGMYAVTVTVSNPGDEVSITQNAIVVENLYRTYLPLLLKP